MGKAIKSIPTGLVNHPLFEPLLQTTREGVWLLDMAVQTLLVNARVQEWLGYTADAEYDLTPLLITSTESRRLLQTLRQEVPLRGPFELDLLAASGEPVPVQVRLQRVEANEPLWLMMLTDLRREKQLESTLTGSYDQHVGLLQSLPVPVVIVRMSDGLILQGNEEFAHWYGLPVNSLIGTPLAQFFVHSSDWLFLLEATRRRQGTCLRELQVHNPDNTEAWAQTQAQQIYFDGYPALLMVFHDITQSKQNEKALAWRNRLVTAIMTAQSQFVTNIDPETLFLHVLDHLLSMTYSEYGFLLAMQPEGGPSVLAVNHTRWDFDTVEQYVRSVAGDFESLYNEGHALLQPLRDGQVVQLQDDAGLFYPWLQRFIGIPLVSSGELVGMIGLANSPYAYNDTLRMELHPLLVSTGHILLAWRNDIRRRQAEADLQGTNHQITRLHQDLRQLVDTASAPIFGLDLQGLINEWNPTAAQLTGLEREDVLSGMFFYQVVAAQNHAEVDALLAQVRQGESLEGVELDLRSRNDAQGVRLLCSLTPRRNEQGELMGCWGVGQDITYLADYHQRLELDVQQKTRRLETALYEQEQLTEYFRDRLDKDEAVKALKNRFMTIASHEFRGPLAAIQMAAENLCNLGEHLGPEQRQRKIQRIRDRADQLNYVINDILVLTQFDAGHVRFHPELWRISELCEQIVEEVALVTQKTHVIHVTHAQPEIQARVDKNLVRLILSNLLHNAIKFSFEAREVWLRVQPLEQEIRFEIEDRGIGITDDEKPFIFEPFYRSERVLSLTSGSGMGLDLVQRALDLHQGEITLKNLPVGTRFSVTLPFRT
ncbi:MAG: PAS domain-containing protein [Candidatus Sericytochromatia bacterium]